MLRPYLAILGAQLRILLQYRAAALAGLTTNLVFGLIHIMVLEAFYASSSAVHPMTYPEVVVYIWLGQAMIGLLPWTMDQAVVAAVRSGNVAYELVRPVDLYAFWYSRALALRIAPVLLRAVPVLLLAWLFFDFRPPPAPVNGLAWLAATFGALALSGALTTAMSITLLWTISGEGLARLFPTVVLVFSGMLVPLPLLPDWAQPVLEWLPFRGLVDVPFRLYLGHLPAEQLPALLAHQLLWSAALIGLGYYLLHRHARRLVVQGG
ncbi:MAG: hypothetical protein GKR89_10010 [Candidatus Latescibacteria bacterium]|nr:hypothetical protein [Candidatus Latescibacterota bacterium]